ncbi:hypothetical protein L596_007265 [Steinernema carpocapsae]|uniref:G-protein coupled receptors family 1 profile domain-containing protein n=1 Tax=Steinernema carpocapsae TaxID=34508 RepID=A0A4U5P9F4_STECR|nr:hypothetical protein L596_007265 [Steinernema carpocapsae]
MRFFVFSVIFAPILAKLATTVNNDSREFARRHGQFGTENEAELSERLAAEYGIYVNGTFVPPEPNPVPLLAVLFLVLSLIALVANVVLLVYIIFHKLYKNFISSHFIAHLCITNMVALFVLVPLLLYNTWTGTNIWNDNHLLCRAQALLTCAVWTVMQFMMLCIAGVHLLTFARIHYEQLFGLSPNMLCILSWVIAFALALPCMTNGHIVVYDRRLHHCIWGLSDSGLKFLTYLVILGVIFPSALSYYAYIRVLGILYHSPIVFQSIGLYKSRFLVYAFLLSPFYQLPFFVITFTGTYRHEITSWLPVSFMMVAYTTLLISPVLYGASLFLMKEEDQALTARAHKSTNSYQAAHLPGQHL